MARADPPRDESARGDPLREGLKHNPFAKLRPSPPGGPAAETPAPPKPPPVERLSERKARFTNPAKPPPASGPVHERIVVRRERKGHGGKAVTIAEGAGFQGHDLADLARACAKALGTGARIEDGTLVVQGEQTERLITWLTARGFTSLSRGN